MIILYVSLVSSPGRSHIFNVQVPGILRATLKTWERPGDETSIIIMAIA